MQRDVREPFSSVGMVCKCGSAVAGMEGAPMACAGCGTAYIVSVMVLKRAEPVAAQCICYPGMCPQGCEPACPACFVGDDAREMGHE